MALKNIQMASPKKTPIKNPDPMLPPCIEAKSIKACAAASDFWLTST
jgi:hypothetical protein